MNQSCRWFGVINILLPCPIIAYIFIASTKCGPTAVVQWIDFAGNAGNKIVGSNPTSAMMGNLSAARPRVACSASDRQGSNFESCVWRTVSSQSSHHPQEVLLAQFSLYVHKGGLKPDSFYFRPRVSLIQATDRDSSYNSS